MVAEAGVRICDLDSFGSPHSGQRGLWREYLLPQAEQVFCLLLVGKVQHPKAISDFPQLALTRILLILDVLTKLYAPAYRTHLMEREVAVITINRSLTALQSMIKLARILRLIPWTLEIQVLKTEGYRDTRGPRRNGFRALLEAGAIQTRAALRASGFVICHV
jgi:hypothetical protein